MDIRGDIETLRCYDSHDETALECVLAELEYYLDLKEDERMIVLPCKVGSKLYSLVCYGTNDYKIHESVLAEVQISDSLGLIFIERRKNGRGYILDVDSIGKTTFLTYWEAKNALEKLL